MLFVNIFLSFVLLMGNSFSEDKGVFGAVFEIVEDDIVELIQGKLKKLQETGELESIQKKIQNDVVKGIKEPSSVEGISRTTNPRKFIFDPTIELTEDLKDNKCKVFAKAGSRYNPLDYISMTKPLIFIDGTDEDQVFWAKLKLIKHKYGKLILVSGKPLKLQERLKMDVYFDQYGKITTKLGIKQVPAIVFQEANVGEEGGKKVLIVSEEVPEKLSDNEDIAVKEEAVVEVVGKNE